MPFVNVSFNQIAMQLINDKPNVRVRVKDNFLQFRPTHRVSELNLPKGERIRPIVRTSKTMSFSVKEDFLEGGTFVFVQQELYGWKTAIYIPEESKTLPCAKLSVVRATQEKRQLLTSKGFDDKGKHVSMLET